jgi:L-rhamnose isomerase
MAVIHHSITTMDVIAQLLKSQHLLTEVNTQLLAQGKPSYWLGGTSFNTEYRINPQSKARFVWRWFPPGMVISELYLIYLPENQEITIRF